MYDYVISILLQAQFTFEKCCNIGDAVASSIVNGRDTEEVQKMDYLRQLHITKSTSLHQGLLYTSNPVNLNYIKANMLANARTCGDLNIFFHSEERENSKLQLLASEINSWLATSNQVQKIFHAADVYITKKVCTVNERWHASISNEQQNEHLDDGVKLMFESG